MGSSILNKGRIMQKFHLNDLVQIADDLGEYMEHFTSSKRAIIKESIDSQTGYEYSIYIEGEGECAWYNESQLTLIEKNQVDVIKKWKIDSENQKKIESDLDWIFENSKQILKEARGSTMQALADCLNFGSLWGSRGEGLNFYINSMAIFGLAKPFLESNNKSGWLEFCQKAKAK